MKKPKELQASKRSVTNHCLYHYLTAYTTKSVIP